MPRAAVSAEVNLVLEFVELKAAIVSGNHLKSFSNGVHLLLVDFELAARHVRRLFGIERISNAPDDEHVDVHAPLPVFFVSLGPIVVAQCSRVSTLAAGRRRRQRRARRRRQRRPGRPVRVMERTSRARSAGDASVVAAVVVAGTAGRRHAALVDADRRRETGRRRTDALRPRHVVGVGAASGRRHGGACRDRSGCGGRRDTATSWRSHLSLVVLFLARRRIQHRAADSTDSTTDNNTDRLAGY